MRVEIDDAVFGPDPDTPRLLAIFLAGLLGRHRVLIVQHQPPRFAAWLETLDAWSRSVCTDVLIHCATLEGKEPALHSLTIARVAQSSWNLGSPLLTLDDAYDLLSRPYRLLLEGAISDFGFVLAMATNDERAFIRQMYANEWLQVEGCGGITAVERRVGELRAPSDYIRSSALVDSDAEEPGQPSAAAVQVVAACGTRTHYHCLARRAIENYLPHPTLQRWVNKRQGPQRRARSIIFRAFQRMTIDQQRHFHMKRGFRAPHGAIFATVAAADRSNLRNGFDEHLARMFVREVREADLRADGGWHEVRPFIEGLVARLR